MGRIWGRNCGQGKAFRAVGFAAVLAGLSLGPFASADAAAAQPAAKKIEAAGSPFLTIGAIDLKAMGYGVEEFIISGTATAYKLTGQATADGVWTAVTTDQTPYATRIVVIRPQDPKTFSGTAVVEWLNVTGGLDAGPDWTYSHREMLRSGMAYVGVSAQKVGVEGGQSMGGGGMPLKKANPARYATLSHPGDAYAFDMFSQAGQAVKTGAVLGPLKAKHVIATGESQSAVFLTTYVDAIDPLVKVYDGFYIHSRFGGAPPPEMAAMRGGPNGRPGPTSVLMRPNLRVPVMTLISETDLIGSGLSGFWAAEQPDNAKLRIWEMPGTAHVDNYMFFIGGLDGGSMPLEKMAALWKPNDALFGAKMAKPINAAPQHHYVAMAALAALDRWVATGKAPPKAARMATEPGAAGQAPRLVLDANGNTKGGIRTPWVDAPIAKLSGSGNTGGPFGFLVGSTQPFDAATLAKLYPGGKADYMKRFDASLTAAVKSGFILPADVAEIRGLAAAGWAGN